MFCIECHREKVTCSMKRPWAQYIVTGRKCMHGESIPSETLELMSPIATDEDLTAFYSKHSPRSTNISTQAVTMESNLLYRETATAFKRLISTKVPSDFLWRMTHLHFCLSGWMGLKNVSQLDQDIVQPLAKDLLTSFDPNSFFLGLGVQIILSGQRISSSMHLKPGSIAHVLHGIVTENVRSDEQTMLFVTACAAKEIVYLDLPETEVTTTLRQFFNEIIAINTFPLQPSDELREYARLRFQKFDHSSSMRLAFPAPINIWLVLHDIEALAVQASKPESLTKDDTVRTLSKNLASTAGFLRLLTRDLWVESPEALKWITEGFNLYGQMVMVSQGLEMAMNIGQHSAFYVSLSILRRSLKQQIEDMKCFATGSKEAP